MTPTRLPTTLFPAPETLALQVYPSPFLVTRALEVPDPFDPRLTPLIERMLTICREGKGVGLAANQAGWLRRVIVIDLHAAHAGPNFCGAIINPKITRRSGVVVSHGEGCLSFPGVRVDVKRSAEITVEGHIWDAGKVERGTLRLAASTLLLVVQHEVDHLDGRSLPDVVGNAARNKLKPLLRDLESAHATTARP